MHSEKLKELIVHLGSHPRVSNLGPTKLWKLIYFIDAKALRDFGEPITASEFIKYDHGPVPSRGAKHLKNLLKHGDVESTQRQVGDMVLNEIKSKRPADLSHFTPQEKHLIEEVSKQLGGKSAKALSELSHQEPAWHYAAMLDKLSPQLIAYGSAEDPDGL